MQGKENSKNILPDNRLRRILERPGAKSLFKEDLERYKGTPLVGEVLMPLIKQDARHLMRLFNSKTSNVLIEIDKLFEYVIPQESTNNFFPGLRKVSYDTSNAPEFLQNIFFDKLPRLMAEGLDLEQSVGRGFRDVIKGEPLKSEMFRKIKSDLIDPLKEYLSNPDSEFSKNTDYQKIKEQMLEKLNQIETKHLGAQKGGRE